MTIIVLGTYVYVLWITIYVSKTFLKLSKIFSINVSPTSNINRTLMERAEKIFSNRSYYKNEQARATYKRAQLFSAQGDKAKALEHFKKAFGLRKSLLPGDKKLMNQLSETDYDDLVIFWSR